VVEARSHCRQRVRPCADERALRVLRPVLDREIAHVLFERARLGDLEHQIDATTPRDTRCSNSAEAIGERSCGPLASCAVARWTREVAVRRCALGSTGVELSAIGLGGVWLRAEDARAAGAVMAASRDAGVNWVDTAEGYGDGDNEIALAPGLADLPDVLVASKVSPWKTQLRAANVHRACRDSLNRLRREVIDVYFVHAPDATVPLEETWTAMCELVEQGLVRAIGLSNFSATDVQRAHHLRTVDVVQDGLSLIDHLDNRDHFVACSELGIPGAVYEPVANGLLSGAITAETDVRAMREWGAMYARIFAPGRIERSLEVAERLRELAAEWSLPMSRLAIAWCLHQRGASCALAGTKSIEHARSNAAAADVALDAAQLEAFEQLIRLGPAFA
jgi:aryl-alcohol dehydrogenase-like predicted oxidoreductase